VFPTKIDEAILLVKEIIEKCPALDGSMIMLSPSNANYPLFEGYHIHVKSRFTNESLGCLRKTVDMHDLSTKMETDAVIIFEPKRNPEKMP
jgi:hypothetical protein